MAAPATATQTQLPPATKPKAGAEQTEETAFHRIRITLTSRNVKNLEKVCADLIKGAKDQHRRVPVDP